MRETEKKRELKIYTSINSIPTPDTSVKFRVYFISEYDNCIENGGVKMSLLEGLLWITLNVYHEARSEPQIGQVAVAHVTLNRAKDRNLSVSEVVQQPYQFSWTFQKKSYIPDDPQAFFKCMHSVYLALQTHDFTSGSTYYHLDNIDPFWAEDMIYVNQFGSHKFYRK